MSAGLLIRHARLLTMQPGSPWGEIADGSIMCEDGLITWLGPDDDLPTIEADLDMEVDAHGRLLTPGLIDCHTHLIYAGNRFNELEQRANGVTYEQIARAGGGIRATVAATRAADHESLLHESGRRLRTLMSEGVTTVEIKSGYGLDLPTERRMLSIAREMEENLPVSVCTTFLGAHAVPPEHDGQADAWIDHLAQEMLPTLAAEGLVDAVDAYCDTIAFTPAQVARLFGAARSLGLPVKLHAEQLSDQGGAALVSRYGGLSADHLEWLSPSGVAAMAAAGTVAVLLPGSYYFLRGTRRPPIDALRGARVPMAVATDCNPGSSPLFSLLTAMQMATTLFGLTPAEALAGATREAARALGLSDRGQLRAGLRADLALFDLDHPAGLVGGIGMNPCRARYVAGVRADVPTT